MCNDRSLYDWINAVEETGIVTVLLRNVSQRRKQLHVLAERVALIRVVHYGYVV